MKIFFPIIIFVFSTGLTFGQEAPQTSEEVTIVESEVESGVPEDEVYENVANEMCACFNTEAEGISDGMRKVIAVCWKKRGKFAGSSYGTCFGKP